MKKHFRLSKGLHVLTICCFLMPFFYSSCDKNRDGTKAEEVEEVDTIVESADPDSVQISKLVTASGKKSEEAAKDSFLENDSLFKSMSFLRPLLNPDDDCYSGVGIMITHLSFVVSTCVFICFLLLLLSLTIKFIDKKARKAIVLLEVFSIIALLVAQPFSSYHERLWGIWVCLAFIAILTIYDIYIARLNNKLDKQGST